MKASCIKLTKEKLEVFKENKSKLTIENKDQIEAQKITVDGCEITEGLRCDYMYCIKDIECFIELKGQNFRHAIEQIQATIKRLSQKGKRRKSFIICTQSPKASPQRQVLEKKFKKAFNSELIIKSTPYKHQL